MAVTTLPGPTEASPRVPWWRWEGGVRPTRPAVDGADGDPGRGLEGDGRQLVFPAWHGASPVERLIAVGVVVLMVAWVPASKIGSWPPEMAGAMLLGLPGVPLLVATALGRRPPLPGAQRWAARFLVAWLVVGLASALTSLRPALALVGNFDQGTGWIFMVVLAGAWALGTTLGPGGRRLVGSALIAGAVANAVVAAGQMAFGLSGIGLPVYTNGQPLGFQGNPVFLGGIEVGAFAVLAARFGTRPRRLWFPVLLVAVAIGAAGERMSMLAAVVVLAAVPLWSWWQHHRLEDRGPSWRSWWSTGPARWAVAFGAMGAAAMAAGTLLPLIRHTSILDRQLAESAEGTFGDRLHAWLEGARALLQHPLLGAGPGQFESATTALFPAWFVRTHSGQVFADAHNIVVEYAVTTGVLGVAFLGMWAVTAVRGRGGALLGFALAAGVVELIEPLNPVLTPLIFLAVGGAATTGWPSVLRWRSTAGGARGVDRSRRVDPIGTSAPPQPSRGRPRPSWALAAATGVAALLAVAMAGDLLVGTQALAAAQSARLVSDDSAAIHEANLANALLAPWPEAPQQLALIAVTEPAGPRSAPLPLAMAARWEQVAAARDPSDSPLWATLAAFDMRLGRVAAAEHADAMVLRWRPWYAQALEQQGMLALARGDRARARYWFDRLVVVQPRPTVDVLLDRRCSPTLGSAPRTAEAVPVAGTVPASSTTVPAFGLLQCR